MAGFLILRGSVEPEGVVAGESGWLYVKTAATPKLFQKTGSGTTGWGQFASSSGASGPAGGVLSGTYPNPGFAVDMATQAELDAVAVRASLARGFLLMGA